MTSQTIENFRIASKRTMASLGNHKLDLSHCILGMVSELEEYSEAVNKEDVVNIGEEIIDIQWYIVNYITKRNVEFSFIPYEIPKGTSSDVLYGALVLNISSLSDLVKKHIAYNKVIDKEKEKLFVNQILLINYMLCLIHGIDMEKAMQNNVNKLLVRFPLELGYNDNNANNRDLESERAELSK